MIARNQLQVATSSVQTHSARKEHSFHQSILSRIFVQAPYNRLEALTPFGEEGVGASLSFESPAGLEDGPIASAEIGRHLAIAGSCALARINHSNRRHYYLATSAHLQRRSIEFHPDETKNYVVSALPVASDSAHVTLYRSNSSVVATLTCRYQVMSERLFARVFKKHRMDMQTPSAINPYRRPVPLQKLPADEKGARALLASIQPWMCEGHFENFPALPVAVLMDGINRVASQHLLESGTKNFCLIRSTIEANKLAFVGSSVEFSVRRMGRIEGGIHYQAWAKCPNDGSTYAEAEFAYEDRSKGSTKS